MKMCSEPLYKKISCHRESVIFKEELGADKVIAVPSGVECSINSMECNYDNCPQKKLIEDKLNAISEIKELDKKITELKIKKGNFQRIIDRNF